MKWSLGWLLVVAAAMALVAAGCPEQEGQRPGGQQQSGQMTPGQTPRSQ